MAPPKTAGGKGPPSYRTAAAAANLHQRRLQQQQQQMGQQFIQVPAQQMMHAPPGFALVPIQQAPPPPVVVNAAVQSPTQAKQSFQCTWKGCRAAEQARPTYEPQHYCHSCCRPKSQAMSPPADKTAQRYLHQQQQQQQQQPQQQQPASAVPGSGELQLTTAQKRAAKRARQRQARQTKQSPPAQTTTGNSNAGTAPASTLPKNASAAAKTAAAVRDLQEQPSPAPSKSITEEVFPAKQPTGKRVELTAAAKERALKLSELAQLVINSIQAEYSPALPLPAPPTSTPEEREERLDKEADRLLNEVLAKGGSASLENTRSLQQAEAALATTTKTLLTFRNEGAAEDDPILVQLTERQKLQKESVERLKRGAPSLAAQKEALLVGKQKLLERQTLLGDRITAGKQAAKERAATRDDLLVQMTNIISELEEECDAAGAQLEEAHDHKSAERKATLQRALERCDERTCQLEDVEFHDADEEALEAEKERDAANQAAREQQVINTKLQEQLLRLQSAAQQAQAGTAAPEAPPAGEAATNEHQQDAKTKRALELLAASEKNLEDSNLGVKNLPDVLDEPPSEGMLQELHLAWCMLEAVSLQPNAVVTFNQLGLKPASLEIIFGPAWETVRSALYSNEEIPPDQTFVPRKVAALLRIQLSRMAAKHRQVHAHDNGLMDQAHQTVQQAASTRGSPYA